MTDPEKKSTPRITEEFFRQGEWVVSEDTYDHDQFRMGPFPSLAAAQEFCDCYNRYHVETLRRQIGEEALRGLGCKELSYELRFPLGNVAFGREYDLDLKLKTFINSPAADPSEFDYEAVKERYGAKQEYEWRKTQDSQIELKRCWCENLQKGMDPNALGEQLRVYIQKLIFKKDLFSTPQHFGEVSELQCPFCDSAVHKLYMEYEGLGDCRHSYYTFPTTSDLKDLEEGRLNEENYEAYVASRCGIQGHAYYAMFYKRVKVGYLYIEHKPLE